MRRNDSLSLSIKKKNDKQNDEYMLHPNAVPPANVLCMSCRSRSICLRVVGGVVQGWGVLRGMMPAG